MCGITGAIIGGGIIGAGASIIGADKQADAAKDAANLSDARFGVINQQQQPFIQSGYAAQDRLNQLLGIGGPTTISGITTPGFGGPAAGGSKPLPFEDWKKIHPVVVGQGGIKGAIEGVVNAERGYADYVKNFVPSAGAMPGSTGQMPADFGSLLRPFDADAFEQYKDPGYGFRLRQGEQALRNAAAAGSGALSGAALKDLLAYNQDMASTEYGNAFNRYQTQQGNIFSRLSNISQLGQSAAAGVGAQGTALAGQAGQAISNAGTAAGAGIIGAGNALGNAGTNYWLSTVLKGG